MATLLYCILCHVGYASLGEVPMKCPNCNRETKWRTSAMELGPPIPWTEDDRRLLRSYKIQVD